MCASERLSEILTHLMGLGLLCMAVTGVAMRRPCLSFFHCLKAILRDGWTVKVKVMNR